MIKQYSENINIKKSIKKTESIEVNIDTKGNQKAQDKILDEVKRSQKKG